MFRVSHQRAGHDSHLNSGTAATVIIPPGEPGYEPPEKNWGFPGKASEGAKTPITLDEIQNLQANAVLRVLAQNVCTV